MLMLAWLVYIAIVWYAFDIGIPSAVKVPKIAKAVALLTFSYVVFFYIGR